jgi:predicted transposase/invertase (TIGR01784 family)
MSEINPRVDVAFKKIFGVEENKDLLLSLVNSIVSKEDKVKEITLLNPYNQKSFKEDKLSILDIKAKSEDGRKFNIEIQISDEADYDKRALYYWAKLYSDQLKEAEDYSNLSKVIGIHILNFISIPEVKKYHNVFQIAEKETGILYFKDLELHTIELKKFTDSLDNKSKNVITKVKNSLDMWSAFLTRRDMLSSKELAKDIKDPNLQKAIKVLGAMNFSIEEREAYENHLKWLMIEANTLKKAAAKGREEGREEGADQKTKEIAINMLKQNLDNSLISSVTGLSSDHILKLKNKL